MLEDFKCDEIARNIPERLKSVNLHGIKIHTPKDICNAYDAYTGIMIFSAMQVIEITSCLNETCLKVEGAVDSVKKAF